jgi:hypothetical protein
MDVNDKQRAIIEFFLSEERASEEITIHLGNAYGSAAYCRASVFRQISTVLQSNEQLRNEGRPGSPYPHETDPAILSILQENSNIHG